MGTVKRAEGVSLEKRRLWGPQVVQEERLDIFCVLHRAELEPRICHKEADLSQRLRSAA